MVVLSNNLYIVHSLIKLFFSSQKFHSKVDIYYSLYDDYINQGKGHYSHLEEKDYNENTLFTTFKMQASYGCNDINSMI